MVDPSQYILSFNLDEVTAQVDSVGRSYTELGSTIRGISNQVKDDVESLNKTLMSVTTSLATLTSSLDLTFANLGRHLAATFNMMADIAKHSKTISDNFSNLPSMGALGGPGAAKDTVGERTADILGGAAVGGVAAGGDAATESLKAVKDASEDVAGQVAAQLHSIQRATGKIKEEMGGLAGLVQKELKSAKSGVKSIVSKGSAGVIGGSIIGAAITAMILGYKETDRKRAESGEMLNVLEASGDKLFSGPVKKANKWFSSFQERAQFHYGIGRKEIQGTVKQMVDAGYDATEIMDKFSGKLGQVGKNTATLAIGLDKHLNLASGESMKKVITLTQEYGDSLKGAASNIMNLSLKAQQSGAGISKFIDSVMSGSSALAQYGIDLKEIVNLTSTLEGHYTAMGLDKQYAGQLATTAASGIASGIAGFQTPMKMLMASEMGLGTGYEGLQKLEEGWTRVKEGKKPEHFVGMLNAMRSIQEQNVGGSSREVKIAFWKNQGLGSGAATSFVDQAAKGDFNKLLDNTEKSKDELKGLKKAFQTEGEQLSAIQKDQRDLIDGMAAVGRGILQMLSGLIGVIVVGIRSIPALVEMGAAYITRDTDKADRIAAAITNATEQQFSVLAAGSDSFMEAADALKGTVLEKIFKIMGENLRTAFTGDFSGNIPVSKMTRAELNRYVKAHTETGAIRTDTEDYIPLPKGRENERRIVPGADEDRVNEAIARLDKLEAEFEASMAGDTPAYLQSKMPPSPMYSPSLAVLSGEVGRAQDVAFTATTSPGMGSSN